MTGLRIKFWSKIQQNNPWLNWKIYYLGRKITFLIREESFKYLINLTPTVETVFVLPKIHKERSPVPGRPTVSGNDNLTQGISIYEEGVHSPFVTAIPSCLRETKDTVTRFQEIHITPTTLVASLDVECLYTNIRHNLGLQGVQHFLNTKGIQFQWHNNFEFPLNVT